MYVYMCWYVCLYICVYMHIPMFVCNICVLYITESQPGTLLYSGNMQQAQQQQTAQRGVCLCVILCIVCHNMI